MIENSWQETERNGGTSKMRTEEMKHRRIAILDTLRGMTVLSMVLYHGIWDLVYIFSVDWTWFQGSLGGLWQQSICWTFIFLSGFCWSLGRRKLKRGLEVFSCGLLISFATLVAMPENWVIFGVLTFLGSAMLLMIPLEKGLRRIRGGVGFGMSALLFLFSRTVNEGTLGFGPWLSIPLPESLYHGWMGSYLGFTDPTFFSTDYFSIFPWIFLFMAGYFAYRLWYRTIEAMELAQKEIPFCSWVGRHALLVYLLHQPICYLLLTGVFTLVA